MKDFTARSYNELWARLTLDRLLQAGISQFVISPGSRSTPLTAAVAAESRANAVMHFDERGAAFFALGYSRATHKPAVLICTSGTATANYYPAVIEASMDTVPMILLTADRPSELRHTGANQTINQVDLYGEYVRFHVDLPAPARDADPAVLLESIDRAIQLSMSAPCGPVHVNCPFREPLAPLGPDKDYSDYLRAVQNRLADPPPDPESAQIDRELLGKVASSINDAAFGLLVVGALKTDAERKAARELSNRLNWPIYADIRSGLRLGRGDGNVIAYFDQLLLSERIQKIGFPAIVHLGAMMTSKRYHQFLSAAKIDRYFHIADHPFPHNPENRVTDKIEADIASFCRDLTAAVKIRQPSPTLDDLKRYDRAVGDTLARSFDAVPTLNEPMAPRLVSQSINAHAGLFIGSSMPVRDMDMYADPDRASVAVAANRGASGIDGSVATAAGFAHGLGCPVTAVIGDLAMLHDMNSLALLKKTSAPVTLVVINNDGGGIFSLLPIAECSDIFEPFFATPHGLTFEKIAGTFGITYHHPNSIREFTDCYTKAQKGGGPSLIELRTDRDENREQHLRLNETVKDALDKL